MSKRRPSIPKWVEAHVYKRDECACRYCNKDLETDPDLTMHIHHIDGWKNVQVHNPARMVVACSECNLSIGTQVIEPLYPPRSEILKVKWLEQINSSLRPSAKPRPSLTLPVYQQWWDHPTFVWLCDCGQYRGHLLERCFICEAIRPVLTEENMAKGKIRDNQEWVMPATLLPGLEIETEFDPFDKERMG